MPTTCFAHFRDVHLRALDISTDALCHSIDQLRVSPVADIAATKYVAEAKRRRTEAYTGQDVDRMGEAIGQGGDSSSTPDEQVAMLWYYLHNFRMNNGKAVEWSPDQEEFARRMLATTLPGIYGVSWDANAERVMREWGFERVKLVAMLRCPRRWGKTFVIAAYAAAYQLAVRGGKEVAIFGTARRISIRMLDTIYAFICTIPGGRERILAYNRGESPHIWLRGDDTVDMRKISAHPSSHKISVIVWHVVYAGRWGALYFRRYKRHFIAPGVRSTCEG